MNASARVGAGVLTLLLLGAVGCSPGSPKQWAPLEEQSQPGVASEPAASSDEVQQGAPAPLNTPGLEQGGTAQALALSSQAPPPKAIGVKQVKETYKDGSPWVVREVKQFSDESVLNDGPYTEWHPNGNKFCEGRYANGLKTGQWTFWYDNGKQAKAGTYKAGKPDGLWTFWRPDGTKDREENYQDNKRQGRWMYYGAEGKPASQEEYREGKRHGVWIEWFPDGQKAAEATLVNDELNGVQKIWYKNGQQARSAEFKSGRRNGKVITWNEQGEKTSELFYRNDVVVKRAE